MVHLYHSSRCIVSLSAKQSKSCENFVKISLLFKKIFAKNSIGFRWAYEWKCWLKYQRFKICWVNIMLYTIASLLKASLKCLQYCYYYDKNILVQLKIQCSLFRIEIKIMIGIFFTKNFLLAYTKQKFIVYKFSYNITKTINKV